MSITKPRVLTLRLVGSAAFAILLFAFACELPEPVGTIQNTPSPAPESAQLATPSSAEALPATPEPSFTPRDTDPVLLNPDEFGKHLGEAYPPQLREADIGGTVTLWVLIDETGRVAGTRVAKSSGETALDEAAKAAILRASFSPGENQSQPVQVWIQLPVTFSAI